MTDEKIPIIASYRKKIKDMGYNHVRVLGSGAYGVAFLYEINGEERVIKETIDYSEAKASAHLIGKKLQNVVNFYRVFKFKSNNKVYFIEQEYLEKGSTTETYLRTPIVIGIYKKSFEFMLVYHRDYLNELIKKNRLEKELSRNNRYNKIEDYRNFIHDILNGLKELKDNKISFNDVHSGNIMYDSKTKHYKLIDIGLSKSPAAAKQNISVYEEKTIDKRNRVYK